MSKLHLTHLQATIKKKFEGKIDLSDLAKRQEEDKNNAFLTRGLAAYALTALTGTDEDSCLRAIVDTFDDNGIDAIYFDKINKLLWIIQAKWIKKGTGSPELGDIKKFRDGIRDLIDLNFEKFNKKIQEPRIIKDIEDALNDHEVNLRIVVAFTGDALSTHCLRDLNELIDELNDPTELSKLISFNLADAHNAIVGSTIGKPIDIDINLSNWGIIDTPIQAFYGTISTADIYEWWGKYFRRLFINNIRGFIGANDVNNSIQETLKYEPEHFWYFNNGITLLCKSIEKAPIGGADKSLGVFHCSNVSIVNGAQTVGNIGEVVEKGYSVSKARVLVRLISLAGTPEKFGQQITKAANTQNRIEKRDFVTQDLQQDRLALELQLLDKPIRYHYIRSDEVVVKDESNCTLEETTIALACVNPNVDLAVLVKREIGKLWEDIDDKSKPYNQIFNDKVDGLYLWRCVIILREVTNYLKPFENKRTVSMRSIYVHGNRFLLHIVFQELGEIFEKDQCAFNKGLEIIPTLMDTLVTKIWDIIQTDYPESLVHQIFRNYSKSRDIKSKLLLK